MLPRSNLRILVVEDEAFIALDIEERLQASGYEVVGPIGSFTEALEAAEAAELDGALLDVHIRGGIVFPVAEKLLARQVPVVLATGYAPETLPHPWRNLPFLRKPFHPRQLEAIAELVFARRRSE